ncbi:MAG TPA: DMT family transporter [Rhodocyclaceae bacterium]|nr:DMT family transporter [Rhodocyclaceae bacterium]
MTEHHRLRGMLLMLASVFCFASLDAAVKHLSATVPVPFLAWVRYLGQLVLMIVFIGPSMGRGLLRTSRRRAMILRGITMMGTTIFSMMTFRHMPLAEATAVVFITPLLVGLLSGPVLGEKVGRAKWIAIVVGFAGVLLIARPGGGISLEGLGWALATAVAYVIYQLQTRILAPHENTWTLLFYTAWVGSLGMSLALPTFWTVPDIHGFDWVLLFSMGALGGGGHYLLTRAFRYAPASTLSPLLYAQLIWAALYGALFFDHWPSHISLLGMAIIVSSSLGLALLERHRSLRSA